MIAPVWFLGWPDVDSLLGKALYTIDSTVSMIECTRSVVSRVFIDHMLELWAIGGETYTLHSSKGIA